MAKMKIFEIARSIQQQDKNIKSGDLVTLLNENGFEVEGREEAGREKSFFTETSAAKEKRQLP